MITYLKGTILNKDENSITLLTSGGVGYSIMMAKHRVLDAKFGAECGVHTYLKVSDTKMELYGFFEPSERAFFSQLISVKSVGPKSALHILSLGSVDEIQQAITRGDINYLTAIQGMGKKTAERIVVELKGKIKSTQEHDDSVGDGEVLRDVVDALVAMGYTKDEARSTVKNLNTKDKTTDQVLRMALQVQGK